MLGRSERDLVIDEEKKNGEAKKKIEKHDRWNAVGAHSGSFLHPRIKPSSFATIRRGEGAT